MQGGYFAQVWATARMNVPWFSSYLYQCFLLPLALSAAALNTTDFSKKSLGRTALRTLAFCAGGLVCYCLVTPLFPGALRAGIAGHVLLLLLIALCAAFCSPLRRSVRVVTAAAMVTEINWALSIGSLVLFPVMRLPAANAVQLGLLLIAFIVVTVFRPAPEDSIPRSYWLSMLLITAISAACLFTLRIFEARGFNNGAQYHTLRIILPAFFAVSLMICYLYHALTVEYRKASRLAALQARQAQDVELYERGEALYSELKSLRHELKNHFAVMGALLDAGETEKLRQYFGALSESARALEDFRCANAMVTSVVCREMSAARAAGVRLDAVAAVPEALGIADADVCSLLSNLLDNAVEGCRRAGGGTVKAALHTEKDFLFITVTNPAPADVLAGNPGLSTTKRDAASHGFGVPIIRRIAAKYDGCAAFGARDGVFTADVMLTMGEG